MKQERVSPYALALINKAMIDVSKSIQLLQWYYHFLSLGKFLENVIHHQDLSVYAQNMPVKTGKDTSFSLKWDTIKTLLQQIHNNPDKKNLFWYMVEINAWRGIFGTMRELLLDRDDFQRFVQHTLQDQYFAFEQVIIFVRNILTHSIDSNITLEKESIIGQKIYLADRKIHRVHLDFVYAEYIAARSGSKQYGVHIELDFNTLKEGKWLLDFIDTHQLYMMVELCHNLCTLYKQNKPKPIKRTPGYKKQDTKTYQRRATQNKSKRKK